VSGTSIERAVSPLTSSPVHSVTAIGLQMPSIDTTQQQLIPTAGALLCAVVCSIHDVRKRRIPNFVIAPGIVVALLLHAICGGWRGLGGAALAGLIAGTLAIVFWIAGGMGAGDVKLVAAIGSIAGLSPLPLLAIATSISAGVLAVAVSVYHGRLRETLFNVGAIMQHHGREGLNPHPVFNLTNEATLRLPFALPVAAGCLFALCTQAIEAHS
jgi:prepilin peptidase CpaA